MSINLSSLVVTGDTSEKDLSRVSLIQNFIESNGGYFERSALKECSTRKESLDYLIEGEFNGKSIDLSIEYKTFEDFSGTWAELEDRLPRAILAHKSVALIIEYPPTDLTELESTNCRFINPKVAEGKGNVLSFAVFQAKIQEWSEQGVQVRLIQNTTQLTTTLMNLFYFVTKESHTGLWLRETTYKTQYINWLAHLPIKGIGYSVAQKLADGFINPHWLASSSEEDIQDCVGKATGTKIFKFLRDNSLRPNQEVPIIVPNLDKVMSDAKESLPKDDVKPKITEDKVKVPEPQKEPVKTNPHGNISPERLKQIIEDNQSEISHIQQTPETILEKVVAVSWANKYNPIKEKTLEQKIIDEIYIMPRSDNYILSMIMQDQKIDMATAHKKLKEVLSNSRDIHKSQGMLSYSGLRATPEMDIGV